MVLGRRGEQNNGFFQRHFNFLVTQLELQKHKQQLNIYENDHNAECIFDFCRMVSWCLVTKTANLVEL